MNQANASTRSSNAPSAIALVHHSYQTAASVLQSLCIKRAERDSSDSASSCASGRVRSQHCIKRAKRDSPGSSATRYGLLITPQFLYQTRQARNPGSFLKWRSTRRFSELASNALSAVACVYQKFPPGILWSIRHIKRNGFLFIPFCSWPANPATTDIKRDPRAIALTHPFLKESGHATFLLASNAPGAIA